MTLVLSEELRYVTQSRKQKFRPSRFRSLLPIDSSVPTWATEVEHSEITESGEDPIVIGNGTVKNLPTPTIDRSAGYIKILRFGYAYGYSDDEVEKAARLGIRLSDAKAVANQGRVERFLDSIAVGEKLATLGLPGIANDASVTVYTASTKTSGGTPWPNGTFEEIYADIAQSLDAIQTQTLENHTGALVMVPLVRYQLLARTMHPTMPISLLALLRQQLPGVRIESWNRLATKDAAGTGPRMITMATGEDVARMIIPSELVDDTPIRVPFGVEIAQSFKTAGVLIETPTAIAYTDGI